MRRLLPPESHGEDALAAFLARDRTPSTGRPWVMANMVASVDGAGSLAGASGGLSGPPDRKVFHSLRALCDMVLVAAGTVRADGYGPARPAAEVRSARIARGQSETPGIAVVTRRIDIDFSLPLFTEAENPTVVVAPEDADPERLRQAGGAGEVIAAGRGSVDLSAGLWGLADRGARLVLCEGGPGLIGQLARAGLLDEMFIAISPLLVAGDATRIVTGDVLDPPRALTPEAVLEADGFLFVRYRITART